MLFNVFDESRRVFAHFEEISFFLCFNDRSSAFGALAVYDLTVRKERFVGSAVPSLVFALVNISLVVELLKNMLNGGFMKIIGRSDELIVCCVHLIPDSFDFACYFVDVLFWRNAFCFGFLLYLLTVFVSAGEKIYVVASLSFVTGDSVGHDNLESISEMRLARRISYGRCDIELFLCIIAFVAHCGHLLWVC